MIKSELKNLVFRYRVSAVDVSRVKLIVAADRKMAMRRETIEPKIALEAHNVPQLRKIHFPISNDWRPMQLRRGCIIARCVCQCWKDSIHRCGRHCFRSTECCKLGVSFGENKWQSSVKWRPHGGARGRKRAQEGTCNSFGKLHRDLWRVWWVADRMWKRLRPMRRDTMDSRTAVANRWHRAMICAAKARKFVRCHYRPKPANEVDANGISSNE